MCFSELLRYVLHLFRYPRAMFCVFFASLALRFTCIYAAKRAYARVHARVYASVGEQPCPRIRT